MRAILLALALVACGDNQVPETPGPGPGPTPDAAPDGTQVAPLAPCLDRPTDPLAAPNGQLTCDLLPPGFTAR